MLLLTMTSKVFPKFNPRRKYIQKPATPYPAPPRIIHQCNERPRQRKGQWWGTREERSERGGYPADGPPAQESIPPHLCPHLPAIDLSKAETTKAC